MAEKAPLSFNFREDLTSLDYQKIIVEQNHAIIKLLALQQDSLLKGGLNRVVQDNYAKAIKPFINDGKGYNTSKLAVLSERKERLLKGLLVRKSKGEDISGSAESLGLSEYIK